MSGPFNEILSNDLNSAALDGKGRGLKLGFFDPKTEKIQTEFIGV